MAKIRRYFTEDYSYGINREELLYNKQIKFNDKSNHFFDPKAKTINIEFAGKGFSDGDIFRITNIGLTSTDILFVKQTNTTIHKNCTYMFYYTNNKWYSQPIYVDSAPQTFLPQQNNNPQPIQVKNNLTWFKRFNLEQDIFGNWRTPAYGILYPGFYHVDIYVTVTYLDCNFLEQQLLSLSTSSEAIIIDSSPSTTSCSGYDLSVISLDAVPITIINSMQGSCIIEEPDENCFNRLFAVTLVGNYRITGGYCHLQYLGTSEGISCNNVIVHG